MSFFGLFPFYDVGQFYKLFSLTTFNIYPLSVVVMDAKNGTTEIVFLYPKKKPNT